FEIALMPLTERQPARLGGLEVTPFPVVHGASGGPFFAYRIEACGRVVAYSGDTEWTDALLEAGRAADLFVIECYVYDKPVKNHLAYKTIEKNLPRITAKRLVLTHMSEDMLGHRAEVPHTCARDGLVIEL